MFVQVLIGSTGVAYGSVLVISVAGVHNKREGVLITFFSYLTLSLSLFFLSFFFFFLFSFPNALNFLS